MSEAVRVLIVDDNPCVRATIRDVLEDLPLRYVECGDGGEVLAHFEAFVPHWVLMDIRMPGMDGITATAVLRAAHPEARVIMVSDHDQEDVRRAASKAGAVAYVAKRNLLELRRLLGEGGR